MKHRHRTIITGEKFEAAQSGFQASCPELEIVRLAKKTMNRRTHIVALVARPGEPAGHVLDIVTEGVDAQLPVWEHYGLKLGEKARGLLGPDAQQAARLRGYDVHTTSVLDDLIEDEVDAWAAIWRGHLGGRLHLKAREHLIAELRTFVAELIPAEPEPEAPKAAPKRRKVKEPA